MRTRARIVAFSLLLPLGSCAGNVRFEPRLPVELPDISRWEKGSGKAELSQPQRTIEYELFVSPERQAAYGVTRYRVTEMGHASRPFEKLQWDRDGRDVRRYECVPQGESHVPCRWREYRRGSVEFDRETPTVIAVFVAHAQMLHERARGDVP